MKKIAEKTGAATLRVIAVILVFLSVLSISNGLITFKDKHDTQHNGMTVMVDKENMNVVVKGNGSKVIVLMTGLGTASPSYDFEPLCDKLSKKYTVAVPEPFGYGFSDQTEKKRSVENIVEEYRTALKKAALKPPYILMPHALSGIYAAYYANKYPEEVSAVVGIDCMLPKQIEYFSEKNAAKYPAIAKVVCPLGFSRLITLFSPSTFITDNRNGEYSQKNLEAQRKIASWNGYNKTVINEANMVNTNVKTTYNMKFNSDMPLLFFSARNINKKPRADGKTSESFYNTYISNAKIQKVVTLEGKHYLHRTESTAIAERTEEFLNSTLKD